MSIYLPPNLNGYKPLHYFPTRPFPSNLPQLILISNCPKDTCTNTLDIQNYSQVLINLRRFHGTNKLCLKGPNTYILTITFTFPQKTIIFDLGILYLWVYCTIWSNIVICLNGFLDLAQFPTHRKVLINETLLLMLQHKYYYTFCSFGNYLGVKVKCRYCFAIFVQSSQ